MMKRHTKPRPPNEPGGVIERPAPIHLSNVALIDPKDKPPTRVRIEVVDGVRTRVSARSGEDRRRDDGGRDGTLDISAAETARPSPCPRPRPRSPTPEPPSSRRRRRPRARLKHVYEDEIRPALQEEFGYGSSMEHPRLLKITLNMGVGEAKLNSQGARRGRRAARRHRRAEARRSPAPASRSPSSSCARAWPSAARSPSAGQPDVGVPRPAHIVALPRIRDFRGINPDSFDGRGNFNLGLREQTIFPEIDYDRIDPLRGLNVTITTSARDRRGGPGAPAPSGHAVPRRGLHRRGAGRPPDGARCGKYGTRPTAGSVVRSSSGEDHPSGEGLTADQVQDPDLPPVPQVRARRARTTASSACAASACATRPTPGSSPA